MLNAVSSPALAWFICLLFQCVMGQSGCPVNCLTCSVQFRNGRLDNWCTSCDVGYGLIGSLCFSCPPSCEICAGATYPLTCSTCFFGYALSSAGGSCEPCAAHCYSCSNYQRQCTTCETGYYRDNSPPYQGCLPCLQCNSREVETYACTTLGNRVCKACANNEIIINNQCVACTPGTYTASDFLSCPTCSVCSAPTYFRRNGDECTTTKNTVCSTCTDNKATSAQDLPTCDTCAVGYFRQASGGSFVCASCTAYPCAQNQYISCANAVRQCLTCPGVTTATACSQGNEPNKACDGRSTEPSQCRNCLAGAERPAGSTSLICEKCKTGFYKEAQSSSDCGRCTNAPQSNSTYLVWGNTPASIRDCPW